MQRVLRPGGRSFSLAHPTLRPLRRKIARQYGNSTAGVVMERSRDSPSSSYLISSTLMPRLSQTLNQCHPILGSVYGQASFSEDGQAVLIPIRPRKRSAAICSGCHQPAPGYDQSRTPRLFEFIGFWGYLVFLVYCMRRVNCKQCGVVVEEVPWGAKARTLLDQSLYACIFQGHWARKLSRKENRRRVPHLLGQSTRRGGLLWSLSRTGASRLCGFRFAPSAWTRFKGGVKGTNI